MYEAKVAPIISKPKRKQKSSSAGVPLRFKCEKCARMFKYDYCRRNHNRVHTDEEPYVCQFPGCMKRFKWRTSKVNHERKMHYATSDYSLERTTSSGEDICEELTPENICEESAPEDILSAFNPSPVSEEVDKVFPVDMGNNYNIMLQTWLQQNSEMDLGDALHIYPF
mmetsp:Transcript_3108/g.9497  ORF Transcript_3108/g.9497 Transcript_3108/m.9497 type:complete len:168 (+) Transcript_3108:167-670(+)|eukprot:CAMPEP_0198724318 /NCGR_PEP_ID=MMETSP1475-20131203/1816_1 /TAXON_ID= ORGANISM="Unidentified sp., Strain CCMP1999" /NCGR_SAMPLE_ID=MMETSP1475 /ASSEMBLY_ACC=CAM_ASM_001111 /LENGTH=167 /DNA_ID=CAMNT_0044485815 /DNA_START=97 /DNA_END=600 /DNA_ORIENTATION=+